MTDPTVVDAPSLDDLYWRSDLTVADVADRYGLPARGLHRRVTPIDAGVTCYCCHRPLVYTSRGARTAWRITCGHCGTTRENPTSTSRHHVTVRRPAIVGGTILVRDANDIGIPIDQCIETLAEAGIAWDQASLIVLGRPALDGDDAVTALRDLEPGTVAVPSLIDLGRTQTERIQALILLTKLRWRVIVGDDIRGYRDPPEPIPFDRLDDPIDERDRWSPTWSEHIVELTNRSRPYGPASRYW